MRLAKANYEHFQHLCSTRLHQPAVTDAADPMSLFTSILKDTTEKLFLRLREYQNDSINHVLLIHVHVKMQTKKRKTAYDTTWTYGIMNDLHGVWLRSCLPVIKVRVRSTFSDSHPQEIGVLQGSILSLIVFSVKPVDISEKAFRFIYIDIIYFV